MKIKFLIFVLSLMASVKSAEMQQINIAEQNQNFNQQFASCEVCGKDIPELHNILGPLQVFHCGHSYHTRCATQFLPATQGINPPNCNNKLCNRQLFCAICNQPILQNQQYRQISGSCTHLMHLNQNLNLEHLNHNHNLNICRICHIQAINPNIPLAGANNLNINQNLQNNGGNKSKILSEFLMAFSVSFVGSVILKKKKEHPNKSQVGSKLLLASSTIASNILLSKIFPNRFDAFYRSDAEAVYTIWSWSLGFMLGCFATPSLLDRWSHKQNEN